MNNRLKFRVWDYVSKKFDPQIYNIGEQFGHPSSCDWVAQQYTGLKDSNGKEIYEGDILSITEYEDDSNREYSYIVEVRFGGREFPTAFVILNKRFSRGEDVLSCRIGPQRNMIVIGNILENPELLKKS